MPLVMAQKDCERISYRFAVFRNDSLFSGDGLENLDLYGRKRFLRIDSQVCQQTSHRISTEPSPIPLVDQERNLYCRGSVPSTIASRLVGVPTSATLPVNGSVPPNQSISRLSALPKTFRITRSQPLRIYLFLLS